MIRPKMSKEDKAIEDTVNAAFTKHSSCVQINVMDLGKISDLGRAAGRAGENIETAIVAAIAKYRMN